MFLCLSDRAAEAGDEQEGVRHAGPADQTRDTDQSELRLQATHRGAKGVAQRQGATRQYVADRGQYTQTHTCTQESKIHGHTQVHPPTGMQR